MTLTPSTFTLTQGMSAVSGTVVLDAMTNTVSFIPSIFLTEGLAYRATVTTGAHSASGAALTMDHAWTFTTIAAIPPAVTSVTPLENSINVVAGHGIVRFQQISQ